MDMTHIQYADTRGLSDREIGELLDDHRTGVLGLADGGHAYTVPVNCYFDGERLWLRLSDDGRSRKLAFVERTVEPQFLVYGHGGPYDSWSVLVTGALREVNPAEEGIDAATVNNWFGPLRVFDETIEDIELRLFEFVIDSMVGRATIG